MSLIKVKEYLKEYNLDNKIIELESSTATVSEAAQSLNCVEGRIAKTLSFNLKNEVILVVTAGDLKIDNLKFKKEFGERAHMLDFNLVEKVVGHPIGGVCPFGINEGIDVYLDKSLKKYESVFPACGSPHSAIELTIKELEDCIKNKRWVDICKINKEN